MNQIDINANGQQIDQKKLIENTFIESIKNKENVTKERLDWENRLQSNSWEGNKDRWIWIYKKRRKPSWNRPRRTKERIT